MIKDKPKIAIVGAGIFGITTAIRLAERGYKVDIFEKSKDILTAASQINQYRLHRGYHYPRAPETAKDCKDSVIDFTNEYYESVMVRTEQYYCISKRNSSTLADDYIKFCDEMDLEYKIDYPDFIRKESVDICILAEESLLNFEKLYLLALKKIKKLSINIIFETSPSEDTLSKYDYVILSTYTSNNDFLVNYPDKQREYQYELCEKPVVRMPREFRGKGVVIMDGPFMCFDSLGSTDLHVMGHVVHAIHQSSIGKRPEPLIDNRFESLLNGGIIKNPPISNFREFMSSSAEFFKGIEEVEYIGSRFTYRVVLPFLEDTDERPTIVERIDGHTISIFSGKISTCVNAANKVLNIIEGELN